MNYTGFFVHVGPCAIRVHGGWVGVASGNRFCRKIRKTSKKAYKDAVRLEEV